MSGAANAEDYIHKPTKVYVWHCQRNLDLVEESTAQQRDKKAGVEVDQKATAAG